MSSGAIPAMILASATNYGVPPQLALEVGITESNLNQNAVSSAGAIGVMQLMPATAAAMGIDPTDLQSNIDAGVQLLGQLIDQFGDIPTALAAYDWGSGNVSAAQASYGPTWLSHAPAETKNYVTSIMAALGTPYSIPSPSAPIPAGTTISAQPLAPSVAASPFLWIGVAAFGALILSNAIDS